MSDDYRAVTATVVRILPNSVAVRRFLPGTKVKADIDYIPRALLHGADDRWLETTAPRDQEFEWTFRLVEWKAERLGLAG